MDRQKTICPNHWIRDLPKKSDSQTMRYMTVFENNVQCSSKYMQKQSVTNGQTVTDGRMPWRTTYDPIWQQKRRKAAKSFRLKHSTIIIMKGFDKGVGDEHLFSPKLWPNSTQTTATGESEILYFPLPSKSLAYKPFEYTYWILKIYLQRT